MISIHVVSEFGPVEMRRRLEAGEHATQHRDDRTANDEPRR
jgi:hypothetical protein